VEEIACGGRCPFDLWHFAVDGIAAKAGCAKRKKRQFTEFRGRKGEEKDDFRADKSCA
jgi:hypothetical protein